MIARIIVGNRLAWLKFGLVLGAVTLLCHQADRYYGKKNPPIGEIRAHPDLHEGQRIELNAKKIQEVKGGTFTLMSNRISIRVHAPGTWNTGEYVVVHGIVRKGEIQARTIQRVPGYRWKRGLMYGVSLLVMIALLAGLVRRTDLENGLFLPRDQWPT